MRNNRTKKVHVTSFNFYLCLIKVSNQLIVLLKEYRQNKKKHCTEKKRRKISTSDYYESISVLKPTGRIFIEHVFNEYFAPNQLFQKTPVALVSFPRK